MRSVLKNTVLISLFCAMPVLLFAQTSQSDAAGVREAVQFQKQKDAADARQAQRESSKGNGSEAAKSDSTTGSADRVADPGEGAKGATDKSGKSSDLQEAIRFEKAKDAAAARQARIEARRPSVNSADRQDHQ